MTLPNHVQRPAVTAIKNSVQSSVKWQSCTSVLPVTDWSMWHQSVTVLGTISCKSTEYQCIGAWGIWC